MKLKELQLQNFRNFKDETFVFDGQDASIFGDNETGKTTLANSVSYLLTDKPFTGEPNFSPKTIIGDEPVHNLNHVVTGIYITPDNEELKLSKDYHEVWTKKRGSQSPVFSGHVVDYYVDEVPVKKGEYESVIKQLFGDPESIQILSSPTYFGDVMPWQKRRELLLNLCGDISDADVIDVHEELQDLHEFLKKGDTGTYTIDELKAKTEAARRLANNNLGGIPARIDEARKAIPEVAITAKEAQIALDEAQAEMSQLKEAEASLKTEDNRLSELAHQKLMLEREIQTAKYDYDQNIKEGQRDLDDVIARLQRNVKSLEADERDTNAEIRRIEDRLKRLDEGKAKLIKQITEEQSKCYHGDDTCPVCHQSLPADQIDAAIAKFNKQKAEALERLNKEGAEKYHRNIVQAIVDQRNELETQLNEINFTLNNERSILEESQKAIAEIRSEVVAWQDTDEAQELKGKLEALIEAQTEARDASQQVSPYANEIKVVEDVIKSYQKALSELSFKESQEKRIAELEDQEKTLGAQIDQQDYILHLCETFTRKKADFLSDSINSRFKSVRFRLFTEQINGGLKDDCEVLVPSEDGNLIPYTSANNAGRVNAGIEIINAISEIWEHSLPIIIDNAESVTRYQKTDSQLIKLLVSATDKKLRLEIE